MKKVVIAVLFTLSMTLTAHVSAATESINLLKGMKEQVYNEDGSKYSEYDLIMGNLTDENDNSAVYFSKGKYVDYKFSKNYTVDRLRVRVLTAINDTYEVRFYSDANMTNLITVVKTKAVPSSVLYDTALNIENVRAVRLIAVTSNASNVNEISIYGKPEIKTDAITNLSASKNHEFVNLTWDNPVNDEFLGTIIYKDGKEIANQSKTSNEFKVNGLAAETTYNFSVVAKYPDGGFSDPVTVTVKTDSAPVEPEPPKPAGEITDLSAEAEHNRVDLSWQLPETENFKHVIIYRDTLKKSFFDTMFGVATVKAATPIFETNGTYFNDLTVKPETKYEYKLTTLSTEKIESDGVSITVTTPKAPEPEMEGGGYEKDPVTGDFTYTWTKPTDGEVKVMVGGKLYKTVPASDGKIVIPAAEMKYTFLGKPDVSLIPIGTDGKEGKPVSPPAGGGTGGEGGTGGGIGEIDLPFKVNDLVVTTFQIIGLLAGIILTALAIQLVPRLIEIIKSSIRKQREVRK